MTGKLQIMDLVVNGPYKAAIRRKRIANLFNYFQSWKFKRLQELVKPIAERALPPFDPPKPTLATGLLQSFEVERELFAKDSFKQAIKSTFVQAGQAAQAMTDVAQLRGLQARVRELDRTVRERLR